MNQTPGPEGSPPEGDQTPNESSTQETPQYEAPPPGTPQHEAPQYQQPAYAAPRPEAASHHGEAQYAAPHYGPTHYQQSGQPTYPAPPYPEATYPGGVLPPPGPGEPFDGASNPDDMSRPLYGASFGQAVKRFFRGYVKFNGRASRSEFWWAFLFQSLVSLVPAVIMTIGLVGVVLSSASYNFDVSVAAVGAVLMFVVGGLLTGLIWLVFLLPNIAIGWRRLHDGNFPGPLWFLTLGSAIPGLNYILWLGGVAYLVLTIMPSKPAGRRFDTPRGY